jgi:GNAT superfamily N-acetyltransferase
VRALLRVEPVEGGLGGLRMMEEPVDPPYVKDYDDDESPVDWPRQFDTRHWAFFLALEEGQPLAASRPLAAAAIAYDTPGVHMLEGRRDLAVLWDIRVHPDVRGRGVGRRLFLHAAEWARERGCRQLKVETQNINVDACRFYRRMGCELGAIHRYAYAAHPQVAHEIMLLWYLDLSR